MAGRLRFICLLHSHQPVGNFDHVIEEAYQKSYLPYVEIFEEFPEIPLTHHLSGCLLEWLEKRHPDYFERHRALANPKRKKGRPWELVGGGFQEPIMTILPERDRLGQIGRMRQYLEKNFGVKPRGLWLPERVWEPALVKNLADAEVEYLTLDDTHFKAAGLEERELVGGFSTEDQGRRLTVYPASEKLRYLIPFAETEKVMDYFKSLVPESGERVVCYADDGEKFGVWPHTYESVFKEGWLKDFLTKLRNAQNEGWLRVCTLSEAYDEVESAGLVYLPENSYREMTEWALPAPRLAAYQRTRAEVADDPRIRNLLPLVRGGNWRNFRGKYPEALKLYAKMMEVSEKIAHSSGKPAELKAAQAHLYRGQCNCPYWHGVFGGLYLPHLRSALYRALIRAENACRTAERSGAAVSLTMRDFDFDGCEEVKMENAEVALYLHPRRGGHLYELDARKAAFNVCDTLSRRYEAYHDQVARAIVGGGDRGSIHDVTPAKESGLEKLLQYDEYLRESLTDHIALHPLTTADLLGGRPPSDPGFRSGEYRVEKIAGEKKTAKKRVASSVKSAPAVRLVRRAPLWTGQDCEVRKRVFLEEKGFRVDYVVENRSPEPLRIFFAIEMNYGLLAGNAPDRHFHHELADNAGPLATTADFGRLAYIGLKDHWLDLNLTLSVSSPAQVLVCPVRTVSNSEGGFESVFQSSCVTLQWPLNLGAWESFSVQLRQEVRRAQD